MFEDYPNSMKDRVGKRLPSFTSEESALLKGSLDFVGINHYTTFYADHNASILDDLNDTLIDNGTLTIRQFLIDCDPSSLSLPFKCFKNRIGD